MNKNYLKGNLTKLFLAVLLIIAAIVIHSCKKDANTSNSEVSTLQGDDKLIADAKNYFTKEILPKATEVKTNEANAGRTKTLREFLTKGATWGKAYIQDLSFGKTVVVPITYEQELYIRRGRYSLPVSSLTWLIIYADKDKKQHVELVTKVPDAAYVNSTDSTRAYTGYILVEDFQGNFIKGYNYLPGGIIQQLGAPSIGVKSDSKVQVQSLECTTTDYYSCGPTKCTYTDTETICVVIDDNGPGGGDSGGYPGVGSGEVLVQEPFPDTMSQGQHHAPLWLMSLLIVNITR
ncbi:hypothetical protein [Mucilaginibacter polytrichastri]|uniref:Uncharacterized protein n=1 Tax=Mucilaginibacter polytrichastri TaxID=1302689 RepID=A0A1Q5ZT74_9SPHI|nr:hypothetical protein [Mucilaginibacter polytrichastri]OKS84878.1 hypothetical protein RG47T_0315 [Mucilaginibacter polytrichastri]SFS48329.1 hypothetical protein SAMN04487890_101761 [Mucilaginibacter polytrichastri]